MSSFQWGLKGLLCAFVLGATTEAAEPPPSANTNTSTGIIDLSLTSTGTLVGQYMDANGRPVEGAIVAIRQGEDVRAQTTTDRAGAYELSGVSAGLHQLTVGNQAHLVRVWPRPLAPPAAKSLLTSVHNDQVIRGQLGGGGIDFGLLFGITGTVLGTVAIVEAEEAKDEAAGLRQQMNLLSDTVNTVLSP